MPCFQVIQSFPNIRSKWIPKKEDLGKYYVYVYQDPKKPGMFSYGEFQFDFEPLYAGKGQGKRAFCLSKRKFYIHYKLNGMEKVLVTIFGGTLTEKQAFMLEEKLIELVGRRHLKTGPLVNLTKGGEGISGKELQQITKDKIRKSVKERWADPEYRKRTSLAIKEGWTTEAKKRNSISHKGKVSHSGPIHNECSRKKISDSISKKWKDPIYKERLVQSHTIICVNGVYKRNKITQREESLCV